MILIVGASGKLGQAVARRALQAGRAVRALSRQPEERLIELKAAGAEVMAGDLRDPDSLRRACAGVTHVVASAHAILGRGAERSALVDDRGHRDLIDAAKAAGVAHFCYISVRGASPDHPAASVRYKYAVEQYLRASGLPFTIVRPAPFLGNSCLSSHWATDPGKGQDDDLRAGHGPTQLRRGRGCGSTDLDGLG